MTVVIWGTYTKWVYGVGPHSHCRFHLQVSSLTTSMGLMLTAGEAKYILMNGYCHFISLSIMA